MTPLNFKDSVISIKTATTTTVWNADMSISPPALRGGSIRSLRSRLGCKTCKIRRVKCGEEKPSCVRCTSTGRKCDYEGSPLSTSSTLSSPPSSSPNTVWRERRAFAYYFEHAAPLVGGGLDVDFWRTIVPQVCQSEPAVWDAINSISALFESPRPRPDLVSLRHEDTRTLNQNHRDALSWYSRSVSAIRQRLECGRVDTFVGLISCVLFICIEALQGCVQEALQLYGQGVNLVLALRTQIACGVVPANTAALLEDTIVPILVRLGAVALAIAGVPVSALLQDSDSSTQGFASLKSAREAMFFLIAEAQLFRRDCFDYQVESRAFDVPQELIDRQRNLSVKLMRWKSAFSNLMELRRTKDVLSREDIGTSALLTTYHEMLFVLLEICISPLQSIADAYLLNFQTIVEQSSVALDALAQPDGTQPPFTFDTSVGFPLWFTCLSCREPGIRRMALALLRRAPQVQGFYKTAPVAAFGEMIMGLEESFGMAMNAAQQTTNHTTLESTNVSLGYQFSDPESVASSFSLLTTPTSLLIPEEARVGPCGIFKPQDGFPPGTPEEDIAKWNQSPDQTFLRFSRNVRELGSGSWQVVHEYIPIDM